MMRQQTVLVLIASATMTAQVAHAKPQPKPVATPAAIPARHTLSEQDKQHLLHDDFAIVKTVREIPEPVRKQLIPDGKDVLNGMVDPGQAYQTTDVLGPKLRPFRRLIFAGISQGYCLVYCEFGGYASGQRAELFQLSGGQATRVWSGILTGTRQPLTLSQLRVEISGGKYHDMHY